MLSILNDILFAIAAIGTLMSGLLIVYCLIRFVLFVMIPDEVESYRHWKEKRNRNKSHKNVPLESSKETYPVLPPLLGCADKHYTHDSYTISESERARNEFERKPSESQRFS